MKVNVNIIFEELKKKYSVDIYGTQLVDLPLTAAELFIDGTTRFLSGHVYVATIEHLPQRPVIENGTVLVCIGDNLRLNYYKEHATVILVKNKANFFDVYKTIQDIYSLYLKWQNELLELLMNGSEIQNFLDCSYKVLKNPIFVLDSVYQYSALTDPDGVLPSWVIPENKLDSNYFLEYLKSQDPVIDRQGAFPIQQENTNTLCVNLFNSDNIYIGCMCLIKIQNEHIPGENELMEYLGRIIEKAVAASPLLIRSERSSKREIVQTIMNEQPLGQNQRLHLRTLNGTEDYICLSVHYIQRFKHFPADYLCSVFENMLAKSIFFKYNDAIMGIVPEIVFDKETSDGSKFAEYIKNAQLYVGSSNAFTDLYMLRTYFQQAEAAIEGGLLWNPKQNLYKFSDYTLYEMISNIPGIFPLEAYYPKGFDKLSKHDDEAGISYIDTLRVFLENNLSYSATARQLYLHRSSLMARISRIKKDLSSDFTNPDEILKLRILLKAIQIEEESSEKKVPKP